MRTFSWKIYIFIIFLIFGLTFNAVFVSYAQTDNYSTSYLQTYHPIWLNSSWIQTPTSIHYGGLMYGYNGSSNGAQDRDLFLTNDRFTTYSIFNHISGNYQSMANPLEMFNQAYNSMNAIPKLQYSKLSIQKCLHERKDLDTTQCILLHRDPSFSASAGNSLGYSSDFLPAQLSAVPSTDYLSLYFICFEGPQYYENQE